MRGELRALRQDVALSMLQQTSASARLQGVSVGAQVARQDPEVLGALLQTLATDPSPNVRLAAVDASPPAPVSRRCSNSRRRAAQGGVARVQIALADALLSAGGAQARQIVAPLAPRWACARRCGSTCGSAWGCTRERREGEGEGMAMRKSILAVAVAARWPGSGSPPCGDASTAAQAWMAHARASSAGCARRAPSSPPAPATGRSRRSGCRRGAARWWSTTSPATSRAGRRRRQRRVVALQQAHATDAANSSWPAARCRSALAARRTVIAFATRLPRRGGAHPGPWTRCPTACSTTSSRGAARRRGRAAPRARRRRRARRHDGPSRCATSTAR